MSKEITLELTIDGIVTVPRIVDEDKFADEFIDWLESKGYTFGGRLGTYMVETDDEKK